MPKILVVEDNEENRDSLSRRLQRRGFEVVGVDISAYAVENGKEALARQLRKAGLPMQRLLTLETIAQRAPFFRRHRMKTAKRFAHALLLLRRQLLE